MHCIPALSLLCTASPANNDNNFDFCFPWEAKTGKTYIGTLDDHVGLEKEKEGEHLSVFA